MQNEKILKKKSKKSLFLENKITFTIEIYLVIYFHKHVTTAHPWCDGHSTSISACGVWGVRAGVQVSRREFHTHINLD